MTKTPYGRNNKIQFYDEYIYEYTEIAEMKVKYDVIEKIYTGYNTVYIPMNSQQAFILPFSAFKDEGQRKEFLAFMEDRKNAAKTSNPA